MMESIQIGDVAIRVRIKAEASRAFRLLHAQFPTAELEFANVSFQRKNRWTKGPDYDFNLKPMTKGDDREAEADLTHALPRLTAAEIGHAREIHEHINRYFTGRATALECNEMFRTNVTLGLFGRASEMLAGIESAAGREAMRFVAVGICYGIGRPPIAHLRFLPTIEDGSTSAAKAEIALFEKFLTDDQKTSLVHTLERACTIIRRRSREYRLKLEALAKRHMGEDAGPFMEQFGSIRNAEDFAVESHRVTSYALAANDSGLRRGYRAMRRI